MAAPVIPNVRGYDAAAWTTAGLKDAMIWDHAGYFAAPRDAARHVELGALGVAMQCYAMLS